jgi:hypothetical protein
MRRAIFVLSLAVSALGAGAVSANPFNLPKGQTEVSFSTFLWQIDSYFNGDGEDSALPTDVEQTDVIVGVDHGLSERLTLKISVPWSRSERGFALDQAFAVNDGVSDAQLGLAWRLNDPREKTGFALIAGLKWAGEYEIDVVNSPGDGNFDAELLFSLGRQFHRTALSLDVGYRFRSGNPEDEWVARLEGSLLASRRVMLLAVVDWVDSLGGLAITESSEPFFPFSRTEEDVLRLTVGGLFSITDRVGLFTSWASTLDGKSTARGSQWGLGTAFSF